MELFQPDAVSQVADDSISRLENGGIPVIAEQRLQALRGSASTVFTTDLSVNEFALTQATGVRPVSQVMGSCVFKLPRLRTDGRASRAERRANQLHPGSV